MPASRIIDLAWLSALSCLTLSTTLHQSDPAGWMTHSLEISSVVACQDRRLLAGAEHVV